MGLFGSSSPFDNDIEKATSEKNTTDQWGPIMEICDKVGSNAANAKECLRSIMRRLGHNDPHVVIQAITLLDACVNNCGKTFHLEVASREFETEYRRLISKHQPAVVIKLVSLIKKWAENDFKTDPQLNLIPSLYSKLKSEGIDFTEPDPKKAANKTPASFSKDPNVVESQKEMDDIAKAIELSLKDKGGSPLKQTLSSSTSSATAASSSLYPTASLATSAPPAEARKVRALYDFEAAEDNELTFAAGEIIQVLDDSDPNWWKGFNQRGEGLFPSNFVTADLSVEPESMRLDLSGGAKTKKFVQFSDDFKKEEDDEEAAKQLETVEIVEEKIDRLLHLLHEANPEDPSQDSNEMLHLENVVNQMGPLIDTELERCDRTHAQLTQLSSSLVEAFNLYHTLMRESDKNSYMAFNQPQSMYGGNVSMNMNAAMPGFPAMQHSMYHPGQHPQMPNMSHPTSSQSMPGIMLPPHMMPGFQAPPVNNTSFPSQQPQSNQQQHLHGMMLSNNQSHQQAMPNGHHNLHQMGQQQQPHPPPNSVAQLNHQTNTNNVIGGPITNPGIPPQQQQQPGMPQQSFMMPGGPGMAYPNAFPVGQQPQQQHPNLQIGQQQQLNQPNQMQPMFNTFNPNVQQHSNNSGMMAQPGQQQQQQQQAPISSGPPANGIPNMIPNYGSMGHSIQTPMSAALIQGQPGDPKMNSIPIYQQQR